MGDRRKAGLHIITNNLPDGHRLDYAQDNNIGIQWTFIKQLHDLDFAGLLSHRQQHAQSKLSKLTEKTGLKVKRKKTEVMRINNKQELPIQLQGENILETDCFVYLGNIVSKDGGADDDIKSRINKARHAFNSLRPIWNSRALSFHKKTCIFNTNQPVEKKTNQNATNLDIKKRKWGWIGHTLHKPADTIAKQALDWNPQGKRRVGRPKQTWKRTAESKAKDIRTTWAQLKGAAQNRVRCRGVVAALCSSKLN
ncbi:hypothetical protein C0Q70_19028 [Pomacea canaliculata]|uniref:DUF6451 domain-containing protein n=1 Tax=Pomacea canaliculata TaxID=400727 RepID=A0A2T7NI87_POMCA|nr:hypothetical protein C0Q70_19028 [Pomacea canaliculata]